MPVSIRLATVADAAAIAAIYAPFCTTTRISFEEVAPDRDEMARRIAGERAGAYPWLVAEEDGAVAGYCTSGPLRVRPAYRWSCETGIYLAPGASGRGTGRALLGRMLGLLEGQGFVTVIGAIALPNLASVALHQALGFDRVGTYRGVGFKFGEWVDVGLWQRDLAPRTSVPAEPVAMPA